MINTALLSEGLNMKRSILILFALVTVTISCNPNEKEKTDLKSPSAAGTQIYIISPSDGAVLKSPFIVKFGLKGMGIAPAGINHPNTGHHHLIVDAPLPPFNSPIPSSENYIHFGGGQTEIELSLNPGTVSLGIVRL